MVKRCPFCRTVLFEVDGGLMCFNGGCENAGALIEDGETPSIEIMNWTDDPEEM